MDHQTEGRAYLYDERTIARVLSLGAHVSKLEYTKNGIKYEIYVENDEFILLDMGDD